MRQGCTVHAANKRTDPHGIGNLLLHADKRDPVGPWAYPFWACGQPETSWAERVLSAYFYGKS